MNGLRKIIRRHGRLTPNENHVDNFYYFFLEACRNERVTEEIIQCLLEYFPNAVSANNVGWTPLHYACSNKNVTNGIVHLLIDAAPDSVRSATDEGWMPFHILCDNKHVDEITAIEILKLLIEKYPEAVRHASNDGDLPIHHASARRSPEFCQVLIDAAPDSVRSINNVGWMPLHNLCGNTKVDEATAIQICRLLIEKYPAAVRCADNFGRLPIHRACARRSPEFCRLLIEAYPGSERIADGIAGALPLHYACAINTVATVEFLYRLSPDTIRLATTGFINHPIICRGDYPIHTAFRRFDKNALEIVKYLLNHDPNVKLQKCRGRSLLFYSCVATEYRDSNIETALQITRAIYDAHPEAIEDIGIASNIYRYHQQVQEFINGELVYARQAKDANVMGTHDDTLQLPLHRALQNNATLGSVKLLVKGNPAAVYSPDDSGALPLHVACQHHDSAEVVKYLIGRNTTSLAVLDRERNAALHFACRGAKYETIALLLEKYDGKSVSKRNAQKKLPIELLWESNAVEDRESKEYVESVFRLLQAYPETLTNVGTDLKSSSQIGNGKKSGRNSLLVFIRKAMRSSRKRVQNIMR